MKRILPMVAAVTAFAAISAVPAMASQAPSAQSARASQVPRHQVSFSATSAPLGFGLEDENGQILSPSFNGAQFNVLKSGAAVFALNQIGTVNTPAGWPFSDHRFDTLQGYIGAPVYQFIQQNGSGGCMLTDSVHSGVLQGSCGSHNAGTYWVAVNGRAGGVCSNGASWLVNVGITNHYPVYPYGYAMFANTNLFIYTQSHHPLGGDDQWCVFAD